jgi:hypothetical protein
MTWLHFLLAGAEVLLAVLLWHRAMPALFRDSQWRATKIWALGMAIGTLGVGQLEAALGFSAIPWLRCIGDLFLIGYATARYRGIVKHTPPPHWSELL